ncbi:MAG: phosphohydrolase [Solirubrobacterales bacterium]
MNPDGERLGGLAWARRTEGRLTRAERARLIGEIAKGQVDNMLGRVKLALGRLPAGAREIDIGTFEPPDSRLARDAEAACAEQPASIAGHSYRTWMFGHALAAVDRVELDRELFYCASLLHDYGIAQPIQGRDFTLGGAERTIACATEAGVARELGEAMADAICVHTTPGIRVDRDGPLGCYLQWGAMVDGAGLRICDIDPANVSEIVRRHPRGTGFKSDLASMMRAEANAVPGGRFALLARCGAPLAVRFAPFED